MQAQQHLRAIPLEPCGSFPSLRCTHHEGGDPHLFYSWLCAWHRSRIREVT